MCLGPWGGREGKLASVSRSPPCHLIRHNFPTSGQEASQNRSCVPSQFSEPQAHYSLDHTPSLTSQLGPHKILVLALPAAWVVCLSTAQPITTSSRTNPDSSRRPPWTPPGRLNLPFLLPAPCSAHSPSHGALASCFRLRQRLT